MKKLVFSFGRFNPPTTGHEVLLKKVVAVAKKENADAMVYSSQSNDPKKNPLPYKEKTKFMKAMFPKHKKVIQYDVGVKNAFDTLSTVYAKGYRDVTMVVGSDRVTEFEKILNKYNDVEGRHGYYNFESGVKVVSAGARDPDAEGVTGMSASKMRAAAAANDFESFEKGMPAGFKGGQSVFDAVRNGMNLSEEMMEFLGSDIKEFRTFMNADIIEMLDDMDDEELFESIDEDFGAVPDFATMVAFGMAAKMSVDAVKILWRTARGANKIRKWAKRNGNKLRDTVNPPANFTQFESLDENVLGRYATAGRKMRKRDNAAKDAVQAAGGKDPRTNEPETPEEWMARREYHLKYAAKKGLTQPMKDLISKKTMGIHKKSASECREIHNIITGTKIDASGNWKPNEKFAVREYPHSTPDHITREYNKKKQQYRKRLQSLQTSEHEDTKDLKRRTEKPWYDAMKKHFASNGMFSDVPKPDPLDFGITWDVRDGKMPHRPYMESVQNGLIGLDQIKKFESVVDKLFAKYDIDFNFTRHFGDRMDDSRNNPSITLKELAEFIKKMYKRQGKSIKSVAGAEAVLKDIQSDLNIPVAVTYDRNNDEFDVVLKTIMRKKNFTSPDKVIKYEENDMSNQLPEGFMDAILGKNMKKKNSGNAEQTKISTDIDRKLKLADGLMKKVKPLGGKITRLTSFRKTPIEKMTPKDLYRALNDWYLSIDDYLNDNPEVDKRHGPTVVKFYSVWEEVADKIQDYMWASGYNVERGKRGAPNKMGNIIADVIKPGGPVMVQTKKLKVDGKLVDIDYNVPKRTDAKWLKMNESRVKNVVRGMGVDPDLVMRGMGKGPHAAKDKARAAKEPKKTLKSRAKNVARGMGVDPDNVMRGMGFKESSELPEGFMDTMKQLVPGAKGKPQKPQQGKKTAMEMQFPYARLSVHRMIVALRKARGTAMKGKAQGKDRRENERSLGYILAHVEDIARTRHAEQPNSGRQIHDTRNIDDQTQSYFMDKIRQNDWTKADQEILNAMVGDGTDDYTKGGAYHARTLAHDIALSVKYAKKDAGIKESVDLDEMKEGDRPVWLSVWVDNRILPDGVHDSKEAGMKFMVYGDGPDGHHLVKTTRKVLGKKRAGMFVPRSVGRHLDKQPFPYDDGPQYSVHKESVELDELKTKESKHTKKYKKMFGETKPCWDGYVARGMKKKGDKMVPNCVPEETVNEAKGKGTWGKADKDLAAKVKSESLEYRRLPEGFMDSLAERDYKKERKNYLGTPEQMERNAGRSRARRLAIKKGMAERGDGKDIHHKDKNPLNNDPKNLSSVTQKYNRSEPRKRKVNEIAEFGQVPDMATLVAFAIAGRMTVQAVRAMWYTAKGMMKIKRWASRTGHKIANSANPAPNYTQFESKRLDELSPKTKKAYSDKATRAAGNEKKYADSYSAAAKADPSDPNYKKRGDQHKRKLANRKKGIEKANEKYDINKSKEERKSVLDERMFDRMFAGKVKKDDGTRSQSDRTMKKYAPKKWAVELKRRQDAEKNGPVPVIKTQAHAHKKTDKGPKGVPHIHVADHNHKQFGG